MSSALKEIAIPEERHYSIAEVKQQLGFSRERTRQLVRAEPGVLRFPNGSRTTYRIPASVVTRMLRRAANPPVTA